MSKTLKANIAYGKEAYGVSNELLAATMEMSMATFKRRMAKPETFTVKELDQMAKRLHTTPSALLQTR